ncbi:MAG: hypothetical protein DRN95_09025, partial [Candidatus Hydrothermarchaeota archaeon]
FVTFYLIILNICFAIPNPAAIYCKELGYEYKIIKTAKGENGICIFPDLKQCEEWEFFKGICGKEYSYCARHGYGIETVRDGKNPYSPEYAVCILPKIMEEKRSVTDLMNFDGILSRYILFRGKPDVTTPIISPWKKIQLGIVNVLKVFYERIITISMLEFPSNFDWRNKDGKDWMTPVKDQGPCGSCWAFAPIGSIEAKINIMRNDPDFDYDLSEQDLVSCSDAGDCDSGWSGLALNYIQENGTVDESCFPYTASEEPCSDKCSEWMNNLLRIKEYGSTPTDPNDIKNFLVTKGPLVAYLYMNGYFDENGTYRCDSVGSVNHAVTIVGYNDSGNYWIAKNSWGCTWNGDGYFKIGYGECNLEFKYYVSDCITDIHFELPGYTWAGKEVIVNISTSDAWDGRTAYLRMGKYKILKSSCTISNGNCSIGFKSPIPFESGTTYTYYAQIDLNYNEVLEEGEENEKKMKVLCMPEGSLCSSDLPCCGGLYCNDQLHECIPVKGGCPVLKAWNGKEFKEIEKLNIHSEEGIDTTYSTTFKMKPFEENIYKIILQEKWYALWEGSHIDYVKLTDSTGKECELIEAKHSKLGDITSLISKSDDSRVETKPGERIELTFKDCEGEDFTLSIEGYNPWGVLGLWRWSFPVKLALSYANIMIIIVTMILLVIVVLTFKFFMRKE